MSINPSLVSFKPSEMTPQGSLSHLLDSLSSLMAGQNISSDHGHDMMLRKALEIATQAEQRLADQSLRIEYLESLSVTDELTGLYNRRGFDQILKRVLASARRYQEQGMLAFIDLDDFKAMNDVHGHEAGDMVLKHVARLLIRKTRNTDYVARLGGDEFAILFVHAEPLATRARALKLKSALSSSVMPYRGKQLSIRASIGLETYGEATNRETLLRRADSAMYRDKRRKVLL